MLFAGFYQGRENKEHIHEFQALEIFVVMSARTRQGNKVARESFIRLLRNASG